MSTCTLDVLSDEFPVSYVVHVRLLTPAQSRLRAAQD